MKKTCLLILLVKLSIGLSAQKREKPQMLTAEQMHSTTLSIEQLVGLKSRFVVISCGIDYTIQKDGIEMMTIGGGLCIKSIRIRPCNNANPANFIKEWIAIAPKVAKGETITVSYNYIKKGDELQMYGGSKTFIVP